MHFFNIFFLTGTLLLANSIQLWAQDVKVSAEPLSLPTYEIGTPDPNPIFFTGRVYQGAQGHIYPYALYDVLTDKKIDKTYNAVYLENKYVKLCILPEIGGRILYATDKTDNYELFYRQSGIKPALIGMLGAWLSGGVEWNVPHHHRASSYMPIDWTTEENADGSKTIWVGETELTERLKWSVGITLYPDRSWVEARVRIINRTPFIQPMLYWANVSVHCNKDYEVIFPPSTQYGADHSKVYFTPWPYGESVQGKGDKVDLRRWVNFTGTSRSVFCWNFEDNFLAGYDHSRKAGTLHVANHNVVTGKKFFLWGNNPSARMWDRMLSDNDGPYLELMVGAYSDNQPDYSWIGPGETREFSQRWYGLRDIGAVKQANDNAAVNLERKSPTKIFVAFNTSAGYPQARVRLLRAGTIFFEKIIDISPEKPFSAEVTVPRDAADTELCAFLTTADGAELVSYQPVKADKQPKPKVIDGTKPVKDYATVEELYYAGLRAEQFRNARLNPMDFYQEALSRDSLDSRVNTVVGIHYAKQGDWSQTSRYLQRALVRPTHDYTRVKDTEPYYYLGVVAQMQGKWKEAKDVFWHTTWCPTFQHAAYLALAQIACNEHSYDEALDLISRSLDVGMKDTKALTLKAYILHKMGQVSAADDYLFKALGIDPLDYWSLSVKSIVHGQTSSFVTQADKQRGKGIVRIQELLEMASEYMAIGAWIEGSQLMESAMKAGEPYVSSPLVYYYDGYFKLQQGMTNKARTLFAKAAAQKTDCAFPFRLEEIAVLGTAATICPKDVCTLYYLGNLYYYLGQKERGMVYWQQAKQYGASIANVYRNLGFGFDQQGQSGKAIAEYRKAIALNNQDPRFFKELDVILEKTATPTAQRLTLFEQNLSTVMKHDEAVIRLLSIYNETGNYDKAIAIEDSRHFHVWEGGGEIHDIFVDSHLLNGMKLMQQKQYAEAVKAFARADDYPDNLEVGRPESGGHSAKGFYYAGKCWQALGNKKKASKCFSVAARTRLRHGGEMVSEDRLFNAFALKELGQTAEADACFAEFNQDIASQLSGQVTVDTYSKFGEDGTGREQQANVYYLKGLYELLSGNSVEGKRYLQQSRKMKPSVWATRFLNL